MNCRWSSWRWGRCSKTCGYGGVKYGRRWIVTHARNGGRKCSGGSSIRASCFVRKCPALPCRWSSWRWGRCSKSCGYGVKYGTRRIVRHARNGGRRCSGGSRMRASCFVRKCPPGIMIYY